MQLVHESRPAVPRDRLVRLSEVEALTGVKKSTIYLLMRQGRFPKCVRVTSRAAAWSEVAVLEWVQARIHQAEPAPGEGA